jgi:hypothetical protein
VSEYRTPEEDQATAAQEVRVRLVLDRAVQDGASCIVAILLGEPADVVERWTNAIWDGLREGLSDANPHRGTLMIEDRLAAIVLLLEDRMNREAHKVIDSIRDAS